MCLRVWNDDCSPNYAIGLTEENVEIVYSSAVITPALIAFWIMMVLVVAELACLDYTENDYYLCTMGIFGEQRLENPIEDMVIENNEVNEAVFINDYTPPAVIVTPA